MHDLILYFIFFGAAGWLCETVFCSINEKKLAYRGFLNGAICPVYGFGGLIVVYFLAPFKDNIILLFIMGALCTTALEYVTSVMLEKLFNTRWWDYSHIKYNIHGRVCPVFSAMFGALSVVAVKLLYPPAAAVTSKIPASIKPVISIAFGLLFLIDCIVTVAGLLRFNGTLAALKRNLNELALKADALEIKSAGIHQVIEALKEDYVPLRTIMENARENLSEEELLLLEKYTSKEERLKMLGTMTKLQAIRISGAFPNMKNKAYPKLFAELRKKIRERIKQ